MKQKIFTILVAGAMGVCCAHADNFVINPVTIPQGGAMELPVGYLLHSGTTYVGFQLSIELPEGIATMKDAEGLPAYEADAASLGSSFNITATADNGFAALPKATTTCIKGSSGTLITLTLMADASLEVGSTLTAAVSKAMFTSRDSEGILHSTPIPDFTFDITISQPDDGYIKFDENATKLPKYTAGEKGNVRMTRSIKAGNWSTIVLPFTLTKAKAEAAFGSDVELAEFSGFEVEYENEEDVTPNAITILFTTYTMTAKKGIAGGKPLLIRTSQDVESFEATDVTLFDAITHVNQVDEYDIPGVFTGSLVKTTVPADGLFLSTNKFYYSTGITAIKAFRGWFELGAVLDKETDFGVKMAFNIDGIETRVEALENGQPRLENEVYDLGGRKISRPGKGLYIKKGKKAVVK